MTPTKPHFQWHWGWNCWVQGDIKQGVCWAYDHEYSKDWIAAEHPWELGSVLMLHRIAAGAYANSAAAQLSPNPEVG